MAHNNDPSQVIKFRSLIQQIQEGNTCLAQSMLRHINDINVRDSQGKSALTHAIDNKNIALINTLLNEFDAQLNPDNRVESYVLHLAARNGDKDLFLHALKRFTQHNIINRKNEKGKTCMFYAIINKQLPIIEILIEEGATIDISNEQERNILHVAVEAGNKNITEYVLRHLSTLINDKNSEGQMPIQLAYKNGFVDIMKMLLKAGSTANFTDLSLGFRALNCAIKDKSYTNLEILLSAGADPNFENDTNHRPLNLAVHMGSETIINLLLMANANPNLPSKLYGGLRPLNQSMFTGTQNIIQLLLSANANPNHRDKDNELPLNVAINNRCPDIIMCLLKNGANPNMTDSDGFTSLHMAVKNGYSNIMQLLLKLEVDPNISNNVGWTPLFTAINNKVVFNDIEQLLSFRANVNIQDISGMTPLDLAIEKGQTETIKILLDYGAICEIHTAAESENIEVFTLLLTNKKAVNKTESKGETILHKVCIKGNLSQIKILMKHGSNINAVNHCKRTPLHLAIYYKHWVIVKYLLNLQNCNLMSKDVNGWTPLQFAIREGNYDTVNIIVDKMLQRNLNTLVDIAGHNLLALAVQGRRYMHKDEHPSGDAFANMGCRRVNKKIVNLLCDLQIRGVHRTTPTGKCRLTTKYVQSIRRQLSRRPM